MKLFSWTEGRQEETKYQKYPFIFCRFGNVGVDGYLLKYAPHTVLKPHRDPVDGRHYRLNIELLGKGKFTSEHVIVNLFNKIFLFRPDLSTHSVVNYEDTRYVLSFGLAVFSVSAQSK
jgi:hypothetical protein